MGMVQVGARSYCFCLVSLLYFFFMLSAKNETSIISSHFTMERRNFLAMFSITLSPRPDASITFTKSLLWILRFFPFRVNAS